MLYDRATTVCFTGHRTYDGSRNEQLAEAVRELYGRGYRTFLSGMAVGFDLAAAEVVLTLRAELADLRLVAVVPFVGTEERFSSRDAMRFRTVLATANEVVELAQCYTPDTYHRRNDFLVDNSSAIIAYFDGSKGGTAYTVRRATKNRLQVINIYDDPQTKLIF